MTLPAPRLSRRRLLAAAPTLAGLAACSPADFIASRPPPKLFELTPKSTFPPDLPQARSTVRVEAVTATAGLNTTRIALRPSPTELDYYAGVLWIDVVPVMVQRREHEEPQDYRFAADEVNLGTEALPSRVRFSRTP